MCTALTYQTHDHYFGRNLDLEYHYDEVVTITPRRFPFVFRCVDPNYSHYAMIGMSTVSEGYPLYYDATNEYGLSMAGLSFPISAHYTPYCNDKINIAPYELIPWILGRCRNIKEALDTLKNINLISLPFSDRFPLSPLHWLLSDKENSYTIEPEADDIHIYENHIGILTNEPPFPSQMLFLQNYLSLTNEEPINKLLPSMQQIPYSRGLGSWGIPGDLSSSSRFVKAAFTKVYSVSEDTESASISQFFHILDSVSQQNGCVKIGNGYEKTVYSSCCNIEKGIYYYKTYDNNQITGIRLHGLDLDTSQLVIYPLITEQQIRMEN